MKQLSDKFNCTVGYSDHTQGIEVPIAAVSMGALIIEKQGVDKNKIFFLSQYFFSNLNSSNDNSNFFNNLY